MVETIILTAITTVLAFWLGYSYGRTDSAAPAEKGKHRG